MIVNVPEIAFAGVDDPVARDSIATICRVLQDLGRLTQFISLTALNNTVPVGELSVRMENLDACVLAHTFGATPNADETVPHKLGRIPRVLINVETLSFTGVAPVNGRVYSGSIAPAIGLVTLRCDVANKVATIILF